MSISSSSIVIISGSSSKTRGRPGGATTRSGSLRVISAKAKKENTKHTKRNKKGTKTKSAPKRSATSFMCGLYYHFKNLRFRNSASAFVSPPNDKLHPYSI